MAEDFVDGAAEQDLQDGCQAVAAKQDEITIFVLAAFEDRLADGAAFDAVISGDAVFFQIEARLRQHFLRVAPAIVNGDHAERDGPFAGQVSGDEEGLACLGAAIKGEQGTVEAGYCLGRGQHRPRAALDQIVEAGAELGQQLEPPAGSSG